MNVFRYTDDKASEGELRILIPKGLRNRGELFDAFEKQCGFREGFGRNWDALYDALCDFSWIEENRILISHEDLPLREDPDLCKVYLEILRDAVRSWKGNPQSVFYDTSGSPREIMRSLEVLFPQREKDTIGRFLV